MQLKLGVILFLLGIIIVKYIGKINFLEVFFVIVIIVVFKILMFKFYYIC